MLLSLVKPADLSGLPSSLVDTISMASSTCGRVRADFFWTVCVQQLSCCLRTSWVKSKSCLSSLSWQSLQHPMLLPVRLLWAQGDTLETGQDWAGVSGLLVGTGVSIATPGNTCTLVASALQPGSWLSGSLRFPLVSLFVYYLFSCFVLLLFALFRDGSSPCHPAWPGISYLNQDGV